MHGRGGSDDRLLIVSYAGAITVERRDDGSLEQRRRFGGGVVAALEYAVQHRAALWVHSAQTAGDVEVARRNGGRPVEAEVDGGQAALRLVELPEEAAEFRDVATDPILWRAHHELLEPGAVRPEDVRRFECGYRATNAALARAVVDEIAGEAEPVVMVHDYHLYLLPAVVRAERPDAFLHHFVHVGWPPPEAWRAVPEPIRDAVFEGLLSNDIVGFHTPAFCAQFLAACGELYGLEVDEDAGTVRTGGREVWVRAYPLPLSHGALRRRADSPAVAERERALVRGRPELLVARVDRIDIPKNILRGFEAFERLLARRPDLHGRVAFHAHLVPSRGRLPDFAAYRRRYEALVAEINGRYGSRGWTPVEVTSEEDQDGALALLRQYDVLMVNSTHDAMNLVAKEGPVLNRRDGVLVLSRTTGAHEELGAFALGVDPYDVEDQAAALERALELPATERRRRAEGLRRVVEARDPGDWIDEQLADIERKRRVAPAPAAA